MVRFFLKRSTKPGSVPTPRGCLSATLRPSLCLCFRELCSLQSKPVFRVPVQVSVSRSARLSVSLSFLEPSGLSLDSGFSISNLTPSLAQLSQQPPPRPAPPGCQEQCGPGLSALRGSAPLAPAAGPRRGQGAGRLRSVPGPRAGAKSWDPSRTRQGAHLEAGDRSGRGVRRGGGEGRKAGPASLGGSYLRAGRRRGRASCRRRCRLQPDREGDWERGPKPSPRK